MYLRVHQIISSTEKSMKKLLIALVLGTISISAFATHHEGGGKPKAKVHKKHTKNKKAKNAAKQG